MTNRSPGIVDLLPVSTYAVRLAELPQPEPLGILIEDSQGAAAGYAVLMFRRSRTPKWIDGALRCSFCGKPERSAGKLIAGPGVYICDACVGLCGEILEEEQTAST